MTRSSVMLLNRVAALESQLRIATQTARSAIGAMEADASTFGIMASCSWMLTIDPAGTGPRFICASTRDHLAKLAAELKDRLNHES